MPDSFDLSFYEIYFGRVTKSYSAKVDNTTPMFTVGYEKVLCPEISNYCVENKKTPGYLLQADNRGQNRFCYPAAFT